MMVCHHTAIPWPIIHTLGTLVDKVFCDECNDWQPIKVATKRKPSKVSKDQLELPDEPPF